MTASCSGSKSLCCSVSSPYPDVITARLKIHMACDNQLEVPSPDNTYLITEI